MLALALNIANLYGYIRCKLGHKPGMADATGYLNQGLQNVIFNTAARAAGGEANDSTSQAFGAPTAHVV